MLILSASAGAGHIRAADALMKDFQARPDVAEVQHWDILKYTSAVFRHIYSKMYIDLIGKAQFDVQSMLLAGDVAQLGQRQVVAGEDGQHMLVAVQRNARY